MTHASLLEVQIGLANVLQEIISVMPGVPCSTSSTGTVSSDSISLGAAPGHALITVTIGFSIRGSNWAGIRITDSTPSSTTTAATIEIAAGLARLI